MLALADISQELLRRERSTDEAPRRLLFKERDPFNFQHGESLRSGVSRACESSGAPNSWTVLREVGLKHRNRVLVSEDADIDVGVLAEALGVTRGEVIARQYPEAENGARDFFGLLVPAGSIESRVRRYAPTFHQSHGHHLAAWELKFLSFCPVTWDMLLSHCDACKSQPPQIQAWV
ncbi:TniQ family protein, partial [Erythrobacter sp. QSSC1-22B]|uniref:TniQ family protein n=1 Tax=Erythrobacter sp. QSSC1-22B TaxID=1860125 RepID=UPI00119F7FED